MDELQRKLKEKRDAKQPKPHERMSPVGRNYGTGRTVRQSLAFTGMAHGQPKGDSRAFYTGNIMVASRNTNDTEKIGYMESSQLQPVEIRDEVFIIAERKGTVNYEGDDIPSPPDEDETIVLGSNTKPNAPDDPDLMQAFLDRCKQIRGNLPNEPSGTADDSIRLAREINQAMMKIMNVSALYGVLVTIVPTFDDNGVIGNPDWNDPRGYPHSLFNFASENYFGGAFISRPIPPAVPIYDSNGIVRSYPSARVGDLLRFVYYAFYLQIIPVQFHVTELRHVFGMGFSRLWGFHAQAFGNAITDMVAGDPNRRPDRYDGLENPVATQYVIGDGRGGHAKTKVTVEFSRFHLGTFPLRGGGCDVLLANTMNVRKIRYSHGAIIADYLMSPLRAKLEYPFIDFRNITPDAPPDQENTPVYNIFVNYGHYTYRNKYGQICYGGEILAIRDNSGVNRSNIGNRYRKNDTVTGVVDILFTDKWVHHVRFTNPLSPGVPQQAISSDYVSDHPSQRTVTVSREIWQSQGLNARPSPIEKNSVQFSCRGLGLTPNESEILPATQFDPGAKKYTRNLPNEYSMGSEATSGWQFLHLVFVKRKP